MADRKTWLVYRAITKLGQVEATSQKAAIAEAKRIWGAGSFTGVYPPGTPILATYDRMKAQNPASIKAQLRRLPSGEIQLKIPLSAKNVKAQVQAIRKALGRRVKSAVIVGGKAVGRLMNPGPFYTIKRSDIGKATIKAFGHRWRVEDFIGHIGAYDVGKRAYQTSPGVLQVENEAQMRKRTGNPEGWKWQGPWVILVKSQATGEAINSLSATFPTESAARIYRSNLISRGLHRGRVVELLHNTGTNAPGGVKVVSSKSY